MIKQDFTKYIILFKIYISNIIYTNVYKRISCETLFCHSSISAETSTSVTLTGCTNTLKLIRMLKYRNRTYNNSYWQKQALKKKSSEKINPREKSRNSAVRRKTIMPACTLIGEHQSEDIKNKITLLYSQVSNRRLPLLTNF